MIELKPLAFPETGGFLMKGIQMAIIALKYISASELQLVIPDFSYDWVDNNQKAFNELLYSLGCDLSYPIDEQVNVQHRNFFGKIVTCTRWVANERVDEEWIKSGNASKEAIDKASGHKLIEDLYKLKGLTE